MECWRRGVGWSERERERGLFSSDIAKLVAIIHRYKRYNKHTKKYSGNYFHLKFFLNKEWWKFATSSSCI